MAKNTFSCADYRFRESQSAPSSSTSKTTKKTTKPYIEPKFRRGAPEVHDGLKVWQCKRDSNYRGYGNQIYHNPDCHPRFYATKAQVVHQRSKVVGKEAKAAIGRIHEDSRRNRRALEAEKVLSGSVEKDEISGFFGCSLRNKTPILTYGEAEIHDKDFTFSGVETVLADITYNCSFYPSSGAKKLDMKRYRDYIDLFTNYSGKQYWELSRPFKIRPEKVGLFWTQAREFRTAHPLDIKREWNEPAEIIDAPVAPSFIEPTGIDDDATSTVSCSTIIQAANPVLPAVAQRKQLPAAPAQVVIKLSSIDTSDEAQSNISEHSSPPNVLIDSDSSSDSNLNITIPELPEAIFADAVGVFDDVEDESQEIQVPWAPANDSMDVETGEKPIQAPLVVIPPTAVPANVLSTVQYKQYKHPFIDTVQLSDEWSNDGITEDEHETYLAYGTELPESPYGLPTNPLDDLSVAELKEMCMKERLVSSDKYLKVRLENLVLSDQNRDLRFENQALRDATSTKAISSLLGRIKELTEEEEKWRKRAVLKSTRATSLSVCLSAVYDVIEDLLWLRGAAPLKFTVNSESTFHPRFGEGAQVLAKQVIKDETRSCPNTSDKCDPTSEHQCFMCISSFRLNACLAMVLEGLLKNEMAITKFQRLSSEPSTLSMIELSLAVQKRPSESKTPPASTPKQSRLAKEVQTFVRTLSNDLTKMSTPTFNNAARFSQSSKVEVSNVNDLTVDDRRTQDFEIDVHASESDDEYLSANE